MLFSMLRMAQVPPTAQTGLLRFCTREMSRRAGKRSKRAQVDPTRGWLPIREKLEAVPLHLPELLRLKVRQSALLCCRIVAMASIYH